MKAVILAAGKGTRMRDLTNEVPKPMLKVHGKPILEHIITGLLASGIRDIFIVTGFRAEVIEEYLGNGSKWGANLKYGRQIIPDGTGKAPELAKDFVGNSPFLLTYGDILVEPKTYKQMLDRYQGGTFSGLITVTAGQDVTKGGLNFFDKQFCLTRLVEKPSTAQLDQLRGEGWIKDGEPVWYNAGIYIFKPSLFDYTAQLQKSPRGEYELTDAIIKMLESGHKLAGLEIQGRWVDVRDPEVLAALERGTQIPAQPGPDIAPRPVRWFLLVGVILGPPVLTWLSALAKINALAVAMPFLGGIASAVVSGGVFLRHFGRGSGLKMLLGLASAFVLGVVTFALSFAGCCVGGYEFDMK